jgi:hypothetical protein
MNDVSTLTDLLPVVILLFLGIATAILSRLIRVWSSPYLDRTQSPK